LPTALLIQHFARPDLHLWIFILNYVAMVPAANLLGFCGQELARKLPKVFGVILETTFGSLVEIVLFVVLLVTQSNNGFDPVPIIKAAILGSILANLLLCLGLCFFFGGMKRDGQEFHEAVSEVGSGLLLVAGLGLVIPAIFYQALSSNPAAVNLELNTTRLSRGTAILLLIAFICYVWFQMRTHHGLYEDLFEGDEHKDEDRHTDLKKDKLTFVESVVGILLALTIVSLVAVFLVQQIHYLVEFRHISDA